MMTKLERPFRRIRDDRKVLDTKRNQSALLRRKLLKKAINTSRAVRNVPVRRARPPPVVDNAAVTPAVRKTRTASEAASGAQRGWRKLYVGDLFEDTTSGDLKKEFGKFGKIFDIWIARNPPGFAFVDFFESRDAARALRVMDGNSKLGKKIKVEFAKKIGPRTASVMSASKRRIHSIQGKVLQRGGRQRLLSGSRGGPRLMKRNISPQRRGFSPPVWHGRSPPLRTRSPTRRRSPLHRYNHRRSPSPLSRRGYPPPPPLPPLPPMFDPYDPRFREMALMGGWNRGRSPLMAPPPPPPPRYRSPSPPPPPPRYRGRSPPNRRSPGRFNRDRHRGRPRDGYDSRHAAASLVYPPLSLPPPSLLEMGDSPPRRMRSPPRMRSPMRRRTPPPRYPVHSRSPPPRELPPRGHSPILRARMQSPPRSKHRLPMHNKPSPHSPVRRYSPHRGKSPRRSRSQNLSNSRPPSPPHHHNNNRSWSPPPRRNSPLPPMRPRSMVSRSRSRSPVRLRSPPRPRSPSPEPVHRAWTPPLSRSPPRGYVSPRPKSRSPDPRGRILMSSNHSTRQSPLPPPRQSSPWVKSPPASRSPLRNRSPLPRQRTPPRGYTPPPRGRSPPRYKMRSPPSQSRDHQGARSYRR